MHRAHSIKCGDECQASQITTEYVQHEFIERVKFGRSNGTRARGWVLKGKWKGNQHEGEEGPEPKWAVSQLVRKWSSCCQLNDSASLIVVALAFRTIGRMNDELMYNIDLNALVAFVVPPFGQFPPEPSVLGISVHHPGRTGP